MQLASSTRRTVCYTRTKLCVACALLESTTAYNAVVHATEMKLAHC
jgi:hypothetical protein